MEETRGYMPTAKTVEWETPIYLFNKLNDEFHFELDAAATPENAKCAKFFTEKENALIQDWTPYKSIFCNPPYGKPVYDFIKKSWQASRKGSTVVLLVPSRTDVKWFHEFVIPYAETRFIKGRLKFGGCKDPAPFPSVIIIFRGRECKT